MISARLFEKYYPDKSKDGTLFFYNWLRSYIRPEFVVLNVGAGPVSNNKIRSLKGEVRKVVGADIDDDVLDNDDLDESYIITNDKLPFENNTFDLAWADFVLEHVEKPEVFLKEIFRVLKLGASFFFRTPNNYHYVSVIAHITTHRFHKLIANKVRKLPEQAYEPYPTYHRLNSKKDILKYAKLVGFRKIELRFIEAEPSYLMFHSIPFLFGVFYERIVNFFEGLSIIRANIFGRLEK
jgi:ubiquinone/menaquinone biosynthesis C-methylase UbiE